MNLPIPWLIFFNCIVKSFGLECQNRWWTFTCYTQLNIFGMVLLYLFNYLVKGYSGKSWLMKFWQFFFVSWNANCKKIMKNTRSTVSSKRKHETDKWNVVLLLSPISWTNDADSFPLHVRFEVAVTSALKFSDILLWKAIVTSRKCFPRLPETPEKLRLDDKGIIQGVPNEGCRLF